MHLYTYIYTQRCKKVKISSVIQVKWYSGELESSRAQQSYGLMDEAVPEPGGVGTDAVVLSAGWQKAEQFAATVVGVFNDALMILGLLPTPLSVEVLHGWQLCPGNVLSTVFTTL